jgi:cardiolipin synthase
MDGFVAFLNELRLLVVGVLTVLLALIASGHAILYKRDSRAAVGWVGVIWLVPIVGPVLYVLLGINRIRRQAEWLRARGPRFSGANLTLLRAEQVLGEHVDKERAHLIGLGQLVDRVTRRPITLRNSVSAFQNGDTAFPAMLEAIHKAQSTLALSTYIFDSDKTGTEFAETLERAVKRGVKVRVLVDALGSRYSWPPVVRQLRARGIRTARFMPTYLPWRAPFWNLRNHRKLLIADGKVGFTGGMNIRRGHVHAANPKRPVQDLHFRAAGPVIRQFMEAFANDWAFTTHEILDGTEWFPEIEPAGAIAARGISDGPDEDFEKLRWTLQGAIASARRSIRIITPYFLPEAGLITALNVAAMRGVSVQIVLPSKSNQPLVHWATRAMLWQIVKSGGEVFYTPPPFDHTKLLVVDGGWTLFGSANWDPRSLRLNFEFDVECYHAGFSAEMEELFNEKRDAGRPVTSEELDGRSLPARLRDGVARLFSPYL